MLKTVSSYVLLLWYTVQENILPVGCYWESHRGGGGSLTLAMGLWQQVRWKMQLVIKHWVVHKAGSAQDRYRSHGTTRRLERVALFWVSWSFACSAEIDWWLQVWGFPLPRMQSRKEVSANGLKTGNSITGADSMVESFAFSRCTWPHTCVTVPLAGW